MSAIPSETCTCGEVWAAGFLSWSGKDRLESCPICKPKRWGMAIIQLGARLKHRGFDRTDLAVEGPALRTRRRRP